MVRLIPGLADRVASIDLPDSGARPPGARASGEAAAAVVSGVRLEVQASLRLPVRALARADCGTYRGRQTVDRTGEAPSLGRKADPIALTYEVGGFPPSEPTHSRAWSLSPTAGIPGRDQRELSLYLPAKPPKQPRGGRPVELEKRPRAGRRGEGGDAPFLELERESADLAQDQQAHEIAEIRVVADDHQAVFRAIPEPVPKAMRISTGGQHRRRLERVDQVQAPGRRSAPCAGPGAGDWSRSSPPPAPARPARGRSAASAALPSVSEAAPHRECPASRGGQRFHGAECTARS